MIFDPYLMPSRQSFRFFQVFVLYPWSAWSFPERALPHSFHLLLKSSCIWGCFLLPIIEQYYHPLMPANQTYFQPAVPLHWRLCSWPSPAIAFGGSQKSLGCVRIYLLGKVENQENPMAALKICAHNRFISLLASSVPDVQFDYLIFDCEVLHPEVDCGHLTGFLQTVLSFDESPKQSRLSHTAVPNQD